MDSTVFTFRLVVMLSVAFQVSQGSSLSSLASPSMSYSVMNMSSNNSYSMATSMDISYTSYSLHVSSSVQISSSEFNPGSTGADIATSVIDSLSTMANAASTSPMTSSESSLMDPQSTASTQSFFDSSSSAVMISSSTVATPVATSEEASQSVASTPASIFGASSSQVPSAETSSAIQVSTTSSLNVNEPASTTSGDTSSLPSIPTPVVSSTSSMNVNSPASTTFGGTSSMQSISTADVSSTSSMSMNQPASTTSGDTSSLSSISTADALSTSSMNVISPVSMTSGDTSSLPSIPTAAASITSSINANTPMTSGDTSSLPSNVTAASSQSSMSLDSSSATPTSSIAVTPSPPLIPPSVNAAVAGGMTLAGDVIYGGVSYNESSLWELLSQQSGPVYEAIAVSVTSAVLAGLRLDPVMNASIIGVNVTEIRRGSIIVDYVIILAATFNQSVSSVLTALNSSLSNGGFILIGPNITLAINPNSLVITDFDECQPQHVASYCHANAVCTNLPSSLSYKCDCKDGFSGDGRVCLEVDEEDFPVLAVTIGSIFGMIILAIGVIIIVLAWKAKNKSRSVSPDYNM